MSGHVLSGYTLSPIFLLCSVRYASQFHSKRVFPRGIQSQVFDRLCSLRVGLRLPEWHNPVNLGT